jgi:hypothetical protein
MTYGSGAWIAVTAGAAAKRRQMLLAEEEDMTQYTQDDLKNDWEFKIVRSDTPVFRKPEVLSKLIEEEAQAGWIMLEKLDDSRVRFKRSRSAHARDAYLPDGVDPYRTRYGALSAPIAVGVGVLITGLLVLALVALRSSQAGGGDAQIPWIGISTVIIPVILVVLGFVVFVMRRRK